jgi:hypothetical protein
MTVEEVGYFHAVSRNDLDRQFELIPTSCGTGSFDVERLAELDQIRLKVGAFGRLRAGPAFSKYAKRYLS